MRKRELNTLMNRLRKAHDAANWQGKFTSEVRQATREFRQSEISNPLAEAIAIVEKELDKQVKKRKTHHALDERRLPYKD